MNLNKSLEYFNPDKVNGCVHVIGCGSVGSALVDLLASSGITNIKLYDDDVIEPHNLCNQMFTNNDIGKNKAQACADKIITINPDAEKDVVVCGKYTNQMLSGYVFLCVDNIDLRREIVKANQYNAMVKAMFDFRTGLEDAQHYAAKWSDMQQVKDLLASMDFSHDEAKAETPTTACGMTLGMKSTVWMVVLLGFNNFVNFINGKGLKKCILMNAFNNGGNILAF